MKEIQQSQDNHEILQAMGRWERGALLRPLR
jgi:hypothetical protein